jgi:glycosyltransferase involved in cell wall biosynthesis
VRLVIVAHAFPRWRGDIAGSFLGRLAGAFVRRGHTVSVVAPADRGRAERQSVDGVEVVQVRYAAPEREDLAYTGDMARKARSPSGAWAFRGLVRALADGARDEAGRISAQLVHAFWWIPGGWAATGLTVPAVVSLMGTDVALMRPLPARVLARRVLGRAARVTALSTFLADEARRLMRLRTLEIDRVPVPVDTDRFRERSAGGGGVVYLGRLTDQKRVDLLLDAVHRAGIQAPVTIVGDGPARERLEHQAQTLGLSNVRFRGVLPDDDVPAILASADVAAFLPRAEGLGLAAAEALMLGVPVVATTDGGGVLDLVREGQGACVVPPTAEAVGAGLLRCLGDPTLRVAAAQAGDRLRVALAPDTIARQFEQVYARVT